jgi:hypothetical protein
MRKTISIILVLLSTLNTAFAQNKQFCRTFVNQAYYSGVLCQTVLATALSTKRVTKVPVWIFTAACRKGAINLCLTHLDTQFSMIHNSNNFSYFAYEQSFICDQIKAEKYNSLNQPKNGPILDEIIDRENNCMEKIEELYSENYSRKIGP